MKTQIRAFGLVVVLVIALAFAGCSGEHTHSWVNGVCSECEAVCAHESHDKTTSECTVCGMVVKHSYADGKCTVCNYRCTHESHDKTTLLCSACGIKTTHNYVYENYTNGKCTRCDETTQFLWGVGQVDKTLTSECANAGTIEKVTYSTHAYAAEAANDVDNIIIEKDMYVYLPYGYTAEKQYNVLYLLHGAGENEGYWFAKGDYTPDLVSKYQATNYIKNILDNMIDKELCNPLIVVTPTLYSEAEGYGINQMSYPAHFGKELKNEIMPYIAEHYSTYAAGTTAEDFIAARDHQAYAAFSMGSMTSFQSIFTYCTDYISWIGSYSAGYGGAGSNAEAGVDKIVAALEGNYKDYKINYWFNGDGLLDTEHDRHVETYNLMLSKLSDRFAEGKNCTFVDLSNGGHTYPAWEIDLYNTLLVFFK